MNNIITILGGGNGAHAAAVDMTRQGFEVRLYEDEAFAPRMEKVFNTNQISYTGVLGEGVVTINMVTSDLAKAVKGASKILVSVPAFAHKNYARKLVNVLEDGQVVLIFAGNFGSLVFLHELKKAGAEKDVIFAETYTLPYATRLMEPGKSAILTLTAPLLTGVLPSRRTAEAMDKLGNIYPFKPARSVLDSGLYSLNPVIHVPGCILNAGRIESQKGEYWFYREAVTAGVGRVTEQLDRERVALVTKLGYEAETVMENLAAIGGVGKNVHEAITSNPQFAEIKGPSGYQDRYFREDIPFGLVAWSSLARAVGVDTPIMDALITLADGLMEQDNREVGRGLKEMGIDGMSLEEICHLLANG